MSPEHLCPPQADREVGRPRYKLQRSPTLATCYLPRPACKIIERQADAGGRRLAPRLQTLDSGLPHPASDQRMDGQRDSKGIAAVDELEVASYKSDGILSIKADVGCRSGPLSARPACP
jgi:hypothetical protein